ncbi:MAG: ATP-binding protein, partial [Myxococcales bacterium]
ELGVALETGSEEAPAALDPFQVQQALLNVVRNALEATGRGGTVSLSARRENGFAVFAVENSGSAIPDDLVSRLGEPFFTTKPEGTGLGLAIARSIANAHGGDLTLANNAPGRVRFELRLAAEEIR